MPPIILTLLQGLFLLLLYVFVARAVRAVLHDITAGGPVRTERRVRNRPRTPRRGRAMPRELVVHAPDEGPRRVRLDGAEVTLGRTSASTVALDDPYVSDHHAKVYRDGERWLVRDEGSTNGTYVNQQKVSGPTLIAAGDQIAVGKTVIEVRK